jgi:hypothetical protein
MEYKCPNMDKKTWFPQADNLHALLFAQIAPPETLKMMEHLNGCESCRNYIRALIVNTLLENQNNSIFNNPEFIEIKMRFYNALLKFVGAEPVESPLI